jgi:hypothetical protein
MKRNDLDRIEVVELINASGYAPSGLHHLESLKSGKYRVCDVAIAGDAPQAKIGSQAKIESCRYVCNFFSEREIAPVHVFLIFKQAPVFRWGGRMSHPPSRREKRQDCRFYGTVLRRRDWRRIPTGRSIDPACFLGSSPRREESGVGEGKKAASGGVTRDAQPHMYAYIT